MSRLLCALIQLAALTALLCPPPALADAASPLPGASAVAACAPHAIGGDRDAHGCIASAGYVWCARTASCERPWELAKAEGFETEDFARNCATP